MVDKNPLRGFFVYIAASLKNFMPPQKITAHGWAVIFYDTASITYYQSSLDQNLSKILGLHHPSSVQSHR